MIIPYTVDETVGAKDRTEHERKNAMERYTAGVGTVLGRLVAIAMLGAVGFFVFRIASVMVALAL